MTMTDMNCSATDERLADYLDGDLDVASRRQFEAHVASCVRCTALVRDLERIRAGAAELPELSPSMDLWNHIARRIETPVVAFTARPVPNVAARRRMLDRLKTAAIAAGLVAVTAGVTYELTTRNMTQAGTSNVAALPSGVPTDTTERTVAPDAPQQQSVPSSTNVATTGTTPTPPASDPAASEIQTVGNGPGAVTYSREIDRLRTIFVRNRGQLDPRTAAIIEANLKVIDDAIAQSKAALAQDPASRFLNNQLNTARAKKLELLRTAALLPSRT